MNLTEHTEFRLSGKKCATIFALSSVCSLAVICSPQGLAQQIQAQQKRAFNTLHPAGWATTILTSRLVLENSLKRLSAPANWLDYLGSI